MNAYAEFDKFLPPLTEIESKRLGQLAELKLNEFNEHDVREEFLAPLIEVLGYRRGGTYDVRRGDSFSLSPGFIMIGRQRVELDYKFNVWKQGFWLMEAKPAGCPDPSSPPVLSAEDVGQAFFYALHPQVDAPVFAVSNGWWTCVYDRDADNPLEPILTIRQPELPSKFEELRRLLGASQVTFAIKRKLIKRIEQVLSADCYVSRTDDFLAAVARTVDQVRPRVAQNFREVLSSEQEKGRNEFERILSTLPADRIVESIFLAVDNLPQALTAANTISSSLQIEKEGVGRGYLFFSRLFLEDARAVRTRYYFNSLCCIATLATNRASDTTAWLPPKFKKADAARVTVLELFNWWCAMLIHHLAERPDLRMLWAVEGAVTRIVKRLLTYNATARDKIEKTVAGARFFLPEETLAYLFLSPATNLLIALESAVSVATGQFLRDHYDQKKREWRSELALQSYRKLQSFETELIRSTPDYAEVQKQLGGEWGVLMPFEYVNTSWDQLGSGVCEVLTKFPDLVKGLSARCQERIALLAGLRATNYAANCCQILGLKPLSISPEDVAVRIAEIFDPTKSGES